MAKKGSFSKVYDKNGDYADVEAVRFDGTRTFQMQGDVTASQTWNGDSSSPLTLNTSIGAKKVTTDKINDKAVQTGQIDDGAVGLPQIAPNAMNGTVQDNDSKLATHAAVKTYVDAQISGQGTYLGKHTVAEINAMVTDNLHNGDRVMTSDSGTVNLGPGGVGFDVEAGEDLILYKSGSTVQWDSMDGNFKTKQTAVSDPTASGTGLAFIDSISQDENGEITPSKKTVQDGTTSQKGVVQLEDSHSSTSTTKAATPNSVKSAYDLANTANTGAVKNVAYDSTNKKITKTINGQTTDVVSAATLKTDMALNNVDNTSDANKPVSTAQQAALDLKLDNTGDGKDVTATFTEASARANIGTGEKLSVMFGKINKWFSDLGTAAFKNVPASGNASSTEVVLGSDTRLSAGASAIQGVKVNNTTLTPDANKVVTVPLATTSADGAMSAADKTKLDGIEAGAEANVQSDWDETNSAVDSFIKNKPFYEKYVGSSTKYKICTFVKGSNDSSFADGIEVFYRRGNGAIHGKLLHKSTFVLYTERINDISSNSNSIKFYYATNPDDGTKWVIYAETGSYCTLRTAPLANLPKSMVNYAGFGTVVSELPEDATEIVPLWMANSSASSGTAPVKVDAYGALTAVPMDATPTASSTNLMTSGDIKTALDAKDFLYVNYRIAKDADTLPVQNHFSVDELNASSTNTPISGLFFHVYTVKGHDDGSVTQIAVGVNDSAQSVYVRRKQSGTWTSWVNLRDAKYSEKIGTSSSHPAIGSNSVPVHVDSNGSMVACTDDFVHDGDVAQTYSSTSEAPISGKGVAAAIAANDLSHISQNKQWHSICVANTSSNEGWFKFATITKKNVGYESYRVIGFYYIDEQGNYSAGPIRKYQFQATVNFTGSAYHFYVGKGPASNRLRLAKIDDSTYEVQFVAFSNKSIGIFGIHDKTNASTNDVAFETGLVSGSAYASLVNAEEDLNFGSLAYRSDCDGSGNNIEATYVKKADGVTNVEYVANQSGGGGSLNKTINGTTTSVLSFMNDSEAVAIWNDAKTAAANAS